jgi:hypothetical protein
MFTPGCSEKLWTEAVDLKPARPSNSDGVPMPELRNGLFCFCITFSQGGPNVVDRPPTSICRGKSAFSYLTAATEAFFDVVIDSWRGTQSFVGEQ